LKRAVKKDDIYLEDLVGVAQCPPHGRMDLT
jgi:hypothetical protein